MDQKNAKTLIERFGFKDDDLATPEHDKILVWLLDEVNMMKVLSSFRTLLKKDMLYHIQEIKAESPILGYNNYNIGFIDVQVKLLETDDKKTPMNTCYRSICIEIKPKIKSIGELIRQINFYKSHRPHSDWIVVTKENGDASVILWNQGIRMYQLQNGV